MLELTNALVKRGWVIRGAGENSAPIFVRGTRRGDHPTDYLHGFVYAETAAEAEAYDIAWGYLSPRA